MPQLRTLASDPPAPKRFTRLHGIITLAALWLLTVVAGIVCPRLGLGGNYPFWAMIGVSGLLGGYVGSFAFTGPNMDHSRVSSILLLAFAGIGLRRMQHGDSSGVILVLMFLGAALGGPLACVFPATATPETLQNTDCDGN
jgi:hypothetical protein